MEAPLNHNHSHTSITTKFIESIKTAAPRCEKPISMNRWCRCDLSGLNGERPLIIRTITTRHESKKGMHITAIVIATKPTPRASSSGPRRSEKAPNRKMVIRKPNIMVPPSPMNIFVFFPNTLCMKNGNRADATMTAKHDHTDWLTAMKSTAKLAQAMMPYPDE